MYILHRVYRKSGNMNHSTQFFYIDTPKDGSIPTEVKNRFYNICAADSADETIDYGFTQIENHDGGVLRTEVIKPMPTAEQA